MSTLPLYAKLRNSYAADAGDPAPVNKELIRFFSSGKQPEITREIAWHVGGQLKKILDSMKLSSVILDVQTGPLVTTFSVRPEGMTPIGRYLTPSTERDIAMRLGVDSVRCSAVSRDGMIYIEVANPNRGKVALNMIYDNMIPSVPLCFPLGLGKNNVPQWDSLASMPHLLVAGTTGSGKSVLLHNILVAFHALYTPDDLRLVLIDPKRVEFAAYTDSPFLVEPGVIYDRETGRLALERLEYVMRQRYELMESERCRNLEQLNKRGYHLPRIVGVIDEVSDFFTDKTHGETSEALVLSIAQLGRAAGIHLIIATQRPSREVITGTIKANFPARAVLKTASMVDSRVIMDTNGAETLLGNGDTIFRIPGNEDRRVVVPFVDEEIVDHTVETWYNYEDPTADPEFAVALSAADQVRVQRTTEDDEWPALAMWRDACQKLGMKSII